MREREKGEKNTEDRKHSDDSVRTEHVREQQIRAAHGSIKIAGNITGGFRRPQVELQVEARLLDPPCGHARSHGGRSSLSGRPLRSKPGLAVSWWGHRHAKGWVSLGPRREFAIQKKRTHGKSAGAANLVTKAEAQVHMR